VTAAVAEGPEPEDELSLGQPGERAPHRDLLLRCGEGEAGLPVIDLRRERDKRLVSSECTGQ
jgi:hypothetical protein